MDPLETLYEALQHPLGLVVRVEDPLAFRQRLYAAMRGNPEVSCFTIHLSRTLPTSELLIVKKEPD